MVFQHLRSSHNVINILESFFVKGNVNYLEQETAQVETETHNYILNLDIKTALRLVCIGALLCSCVRPIETKAKQNTHVSGNEAGIIGFVLMTEKV